MFATIDLKEIYGKPLQPLLCQKACDASLPHVHKNLIPVLKCNPNLRLVLSISVNK